LNQAGDYAAFTFQPLLLRRQLDFFYSLYWLGVSALTKSCYAAAMANQKTDHYSAKEAHERFEAALRGARLAGPKHNESLTPKRQRKQQKKRPNKAQSTP
jgi:hypothetical protein